MHLKTDLKSKILVWIRSLRTNFYRPSWTVQPCPARPGFTILKSLLKSVVIQDEIILGTVSSTNGTDLLSAGVR